MPENMDADGVITGLSRFVTSARDGVLAWDFWCGDV